MNARVAIAGVCAFGWAATLCVATPIPADQQIQARVVRTLAAPGDQPMHMPTDVAIGADGRAYVADGTNDRIVCFRADGEIDVAITQIDGEVLRRPVGISVDYADQLWIADSGNHRLVVVGRDGSLVQTIDLPDAEGAGPAEPTDLVVTADGRRTYIVDNDNHRIVVRENQTGRLSFLGRFGRGLGRFQWPFMICVGAEGSLYVTEVIGARVQRISPTDQWAGQISRWGVELGRLYRPKGIATDADGRIYVSDSTLSVVQVFDPRGTIRGVLTDQQGNPLRFDHPMGMCFDSAGLLYVVELGANRVAVVSIEAVSVSTTTMPTGRDEKGGGQ